MSNLLSLSPSSHRTASANASREVACFSGGNFILGGLLLNEQRYIDFGLELTASCRATYAATKTGIGPESWWWQDSVEPVTESSNQGPATEEEQEFYNRAGFWIDSSIYALRPETIESYYYAYRATGDEKYKEWAWDAILRINYTCAIGSGYSAITNVDEPRGGGFYDFQESFWFAEVLKYSYLIFAEVRLFPCSTCLVLSVLAADLCCRLQDADFQVKADGTNKYVYNTEAHPVKIAPT